MTSRHWYGREIFWVLWLLYKAVTKVRLSKIGNPVDIVAAGWGIPKATEKSPLLET